MLGETVKDRLLLATVRLLGERADASGITARQIAREADVNLAMINYYFGSKDALLTAAVRLVIADKAAALREIGGRSGPADRKLRDFLTTMSDITMEYAGLTRPTVPWILLEGDLDATHHLLPLVRECFGDRRSDTECRIIAYQLVSFSQLVFYRSASFLKYTGIDIEDKRQRDELFQTILDIYLNE
jgi:AcrR family transcriptional regulator